MNSTLSAKVSSKDLVVIDKIDLPKSKTKIMASVLKKLGIKGSLLILISKNEHYIERAARNLAGVMVKNIDNISLYDIVSHKKILLTKETITKIEEVFG